MIERVVKGTKTRFDSGASVEFDNVPTKNSNNAVKSGGIYNSLEDKVDKFPYDTPINYCPVPEYSSDSVYGVTFTKNADGTITVNGTNNGLSNSLYNLTEATGNAPAYSLQLEAGVQYKLTGCPAEGSSTTYLITISDGTTTLYDKGSGVTFTASANPYIVQIGVIKNAVVENLVFSPMIKKLSDYEEDPTFVPYIPTNKQVNTNAIDKNTGAIKALTLATGKNLAKMKYYDGTTESMGGGLTATYNSDGTITISAGTASAQAYVFPASHGNGQLDFIGNKGFILSGVPSTAPDGVTLRLRYNNGSNINVIYCDNTGEQKFYFTEDMAQASGGYHLMINVAKNNVIPEGGITISPMIRYVEVTDSTYMPYTKTNKELTDDTGNLSELETTDKTDLVNALNEVNGKTPLPNQEGTPTVDLTNLKIGDTLYGISAGGESSDPRIQALEPWSGITSFSGDYIWTDGTDIYFSNANTQYVLDKSTSTWSTKTWSGLTSFDGRYIWTDGTSIYYSYGPKNYVLDKAISTWSTKAWSGLTVFDGIYIWTDGTDIYYSSGSNHYVLDKSTSTWSTKTWSGLTAFSGAYIWTDGTDIYYSTNSEQYILNKSTSTWSVKTWNGITKFDGRYVWTDGVDIYYSYRASQSNYVLDKSTSTWSAKTWNGLTSFDRPYIWTDGTSIYYSTNSSQYVLGNGTNIWFQKVGFYNLLGNILYS